MAHDAFALTVGQAHELDLALRRHGWTAADVHLLCKANLSAVREFITNEKAYNEWVLHRNESKEYDDPWLKLHLNELPFTVYTDNLLKELFLLTVGDLVGKSRKELLALPGFSDKTLKGIEETLRDLNSLLSLKDD